MIGWVVAGVLYGLGLMLVHMQGLSDSRRETLALAIVWPVVAVAALCVSIMEAFDR